ncbi:MAG: hypothetical protein WB621_15610 [Candidatus Acidiferrales bacterium]
MGEIPSEEPDFTFNEGALGIEVSELLRPASSNHGIMPVAEESYHQEILQMAQTEYYADPDAKPAKIILYFANARGKKRDEREMAHNLAEFVKANVHTARPIANFEALRLPEGLGAMSIAAESGNWWTGEGGNITLVDIREALGYAISAKNKLVPAYRKNLAPGAQIWLLLYSTAAVSRGMPVPHGIDEWRMDFDFDRVFWFASLKNLFVEIQRTETAKTARNPS